MFLNSEKLLVFFNVNGENEFEIIIVFVKKLSIDCSCDVMNEEIKLVTKNCLIMCT